MTRVAAALVGATLLAASARALPPAAQPATPAFTVVEASIADLRRAMEAGQATSRAITEQSLARIARHGTPLNAVIALNPRALDEADDRDRDRREGRTLGPLHGIPIALKDNIHTLDMPTTGGALAFADLRPPYEATLTRLLREAGAVILAKTTMTELGNWVATGMPAGYSALGGFSVNPYAPARDPREAAAAARPLPSPGGSSSGIGTAASFWAASVGTETSGSILNPANQTRLVGIKPTVGRISRHGVIPITRDQDTPGPMARSVADAAILLGALEAPAPDPNDPATGRCALPPGRDYTPHLRSDGLEGARIGIPRAAFHDPIVTPGGRSVGGLSPAERQVMLEAIAALARAGATIVDPADLPSVVAAEPADNLLDWPICVGRAKGRDSDCSIVLKYGMKRDFTAWLASLGARAPVGTLGELRAWNRDHAPDGALRFGQDQLDASDEMDVQADRPRYLADRDKDLRLAGRDGIDAALRAQALDALLFPSYYAASVPARAGYPSILVPFGTIPAVTIGPRPGTGEPPMSPAGVMFAGTACSEPRLIEMAYAFEQATSGRIAPRLD